MQAFEHFLSCVGVSYPGPWIWHNIGIESDCSLRKLAGDHDLLKKKGYHIRMQNIHLR